MKTLQNIKKTSTPKKYRKGTLLAELGRMRLVLIDAAGTKRYVVSGKIDHDEASDNVRWTYTHFEPAWENFFLAALVDLYDQFAYATTGNYFTTKAAASEFPEDNSPLCFAILSELEDVLNRWQDKLWLTGHAEAKRRVITHGESYDHPANLGDYSEAA